MIYLIRHGESTVDLEHRLTCKQHAGSLTTYGRKQARLVGNWLAHKQITHIYNSPFERAQQTAAIIGELINVKPKTNVDLAEADCGELEGRTDTYSWGRWEAIYKQWKRADWDATYPDGENYRQVYTRLHRAIQQAEYGDNVALITHGSIVQAVVPYLCVNAAALQRVDPISHTGIVVLAPFVAGRYACEAWNLIEHLQDAPNS